MLVNPRTGKMRSIHFDKPTYEGYASMQSVFTYNKGRSEVAGIFEKYNYADWYPAVTKATGGDYKYVQDLTPLPSANRSSVSPVITYIFPLTITGGTYSTFSIFGYGFGTTPGIVYVKNPNDGGATLLQVTPVHILIWEDEYIELYMPGVAGSGPVGVIVNNVAVESEETVHILYSELETEIVYENTTWLLQTALRKNNANGSMQFQYNTAFSNNAEARRSFMRAFDNWRCAADVNFRLGAVTNINVAAIDYTNVIAFDTNDPLPPGVSGRTSTSGPNCWNGSYPATPVADIDIIFDANPAGGWQFGPTYPEQLDFESVALHELGHALQLRHVLEPDHVMWPFLDPGDEKRTLHPDDIAGGIDTRTRGVSNPSYCNYDPLKPYIANKYVDISSTNTVQSGDSWSTSYTYLQDLTQLAFSNACFDTLFAAEGIYYPDEGWFTSDNAQGSTFDFSKPMVMMGGYPAGGGARDIEDHPTILSGDLEKDNLLDGENAFNVVKLNANVTLDGLTIEFGYGDANGGPQSVGAGLTNNADCTLRNMIFRKNKARGSIANPNGKGGAIHNASGTLNVYNSLFYQNEATQFGNAISINAGVFNGANCTFVNNGSSAVSTFHFISGANILRNSIFWHNNTGLDIGITSPATLMMNYVMLEETQMPAGSTGFNMMFGRNPLFIDEAAQNYRIEYCSPAMNTAWNAYNPTTLDVAGNARVQGGIIDVGAYESSYSSPSNQVTTTADSGPGSLRTIVANLCEYTTAVFNPSLNNATIQLTSGPISLNKEVTIFGAPGNTMTISAGGISHIFDVTSGKNVFLTNLALAGGASQTGLGNCVKNYGTLFLNTVKMQSQPGAAQIQTLANYGAGQLRINGTVTIK